MESPTTRRRTPLYVHQIIIRKVHTNFLLIRSFLALLLDVVDATISIELKGHLPLSSAARTSSPRISRSATGACTACDTRRASSWATSFNWCTLFLAEPAEKVNNLECAANRAARQESNGDGGFHRSAALGQQAGFFLGHHPCLFKQER